MRTNEEKSDFITQFKKRIKNWILRVIKLCETFPKSSTARVINYSNHLPLRGQIIEQHAEPDHKMNSFLRFVLQ